MVQKIWLHSFYSDSSLEGLISQIARSLIRLEKGVAAHGNVAKRLASRVEGARKKAEKTKNVRGLAAVMRAVEHHMNERFNILKAELTQLEKIKHYEEVVEYDKLKLLEKDKELVLRMEKEHKLTKPQAEALLHHIKLIREYIHAKLIKDKYAEYTIRQKT